MTCLARFDKKAMSSAPQSPQRRCGRLWPSPRPFERVLPPSAVVIGAGEGNTTVVAIAWVRMHNASRAARLLQLVDTYGTGNISPPRRRTP